MSGSTRAITLSLSVRDADTVKRQLEALGPAGENALKRLEDAARRASSRNGMAGLGDAAEGASSRMGAAFSLLSSQGARIVALLGAGGGLAGTMNALVRAGDAFTASMGRLRQATGSVQSAAEVYQALYRNALQTGVSVDESVSAFQRFSVAARAIGATREQVTQLVTGLQRVAIVSGSSGQEISSAALQLSQALASGTLQGDELRSVLEAMPLLAEALARQLGVTVGQLRQMGSDGQLTADRVFPALLRATQEIGREFEQAPLTVERAFGGLNVAAGNFLAQLDQAIGLSAALARGLAGAAAALDGARRGVGLLSPDEELAQRRARADLLAARLGAADAQGSGPSLRAPANRNSIRPGLVGAARTAAGGTVAGDVEEMRREYFGLLAEIETAERDSAARRAAEQEQAAQQAAESRRQRATQTLERLQRDLDAEFKARQDHEKRVRELREAEAAGAISPAERVRLQRLADRERDEALRRAAGRGGGDAAARRENAAAERELNDAIRDRDGLLRSLETPYDTYIRRLEELADLQDRLPEGKRLTDEQLQRAADALSRNLDEAERRAGRVDDTARQLGLTFSSAFEDAIIKGEKLQTVLKGIGADLARIIIRKSVTEPLANAIGGLDLGKVFSSLATSLFGGATTSAAGNIFAGGNVIPFANGGVVNGPTFFPMPNGTGLMGEAGPEGIFPLRRNARGQLGIMAEGGGGMVVNQNFTIDARGADAGVDQKIRAGIAVAVEQANARLLAQINRGGSVAKTVGRRA